MFPKVIGIMSKPRFLPMKEKVGTFSKNKAPIKPKSTKANAEIKEFNKVTFKVDLKKSFPNKLAKSEK